jgi:hypothetical protein
VEEAIAKKTARSAAATVAEFLLLVTANSSSVSSTAPDTTADDLVETDAAARASGFSRIFFHDVLTCSVLEWTPTTGWRVATRTGPDDDRRGG